MTGALDPVCARWVVGLATVALVAIRAPHGQRSRGVRVVRSAKGAVENALLLVAWVGFFVPLLWVLAGAFRSADYPSHPAPFAAGTALYVLALWLFHRSHADLGTNWSVTLQVRERHALVTTGVYRRVRHPMYTALLLLSLAQALVLPNWIAGPSYLVAMTLLVALRLGPEERLMRETFGAQYDAYAARTRRLVPRVW